MNAIVDMLNTAGRAFVEFSLPMLIQSCVLILILLAVDAFLKRRVRAVFRYWIWMLVLVKLVLPPSLGSPVSVGTWFGDTLDGPAASLLEPEPPVVVEPQTVDLPSTTSAILSVPDPTIAQPLAPPPTAAPRETAEADPPTPAVSLSWQGLLLVIWSVVAFTLMLLLIQRAFFVRGLLAQSEEAGRAMLSELEDCRRRLGLRRAVGLRLSPNATSPAVCGLFHPVILIPQSIAPRLQSHDLQAVLLHELAHVKRGDLWINLAQTLLQIAYFYNPLLWLANAMIRRTREQAVDETVLVAMGETAQQYPETLLNIAKLAFTRRPALSLRLIGVVESKSALTARIKHILNRPIPKTARLGLLGLLTILLVAAVLLPMARATEGDASVDSQGPLDIRLVGVRPDGGDELYDADGRKLSIPMSFLGYNGGGAWKSEDQQRDFVLQTPQLNEPLLFLHTWIRAAGTDRIVGGGLVYSVGSEDPSTLILSSTLDREYRRLGGMIAAPTAPVARVDLPLKYFYGKARDALCTFTGPFVPGKAVQADAGRPFQLTPEAVGYGDGTLLKFRFSTDQEFEGSTWVLAYDKQGRRYLLDSGEDAQRYHGIDRPYQVNAVPWDQISAITVGEKAYEITFRNVVVRYPGRPARTHAAYLDVMAQRLGLTGMSPEQLRQYTVRNPQEALAVLDVVRGDWHIRTTFEVLERARPPIRVSELDAATQQKIREVAARWAQSTTVSQYGIQLGLMGQWPEFFDRAMDRLEREYPSDRLHYYYERMRLEANRQLAYALSMWWTELNAQQVERIKRLILDAPGDRAASNWLFWCLRKAKSQEVVDALWELAQDERPWIWWNALAAWYNQTARTRGGGYEDLPEKIRVRLFLVEGIPVDEALKARASALLARLLTPEVVGLSSEVGNQVLRKVMEGFDRETITQIFVESLRQMQSAMTSRQWLADYPRRSNFTSMAVRMIRVLNVWYGVDIGRLGTNDVTASSLDGPQTFAGFQALIAEALEWHRVNRGVRPLEMVFEGRVVDTAGRPVPAAELSLTAMERDGEGHRSSDNPQVVHGRTDADGAFVFKSPANTHHMLRVVADGFAARERVSVAQLPDGRFYVSEGTGDNVIVLEKPSSLSGRVIGLDGQPMAGASVHLWSYPTHAVPVLGQRVLDEQGRFTGDATMSGHHLVRYGEREQSDGAREYEGITAFSLVHVPEGRAVDDVVLDLRQSTAALEIEIVGQDGRPVGVDHLALEIDMPSGRPRYVGVLYLQDVKPRPVHRFPNLPPMEGHVSVLVMGRPTKRVPVKLVANGITRCTVEIDASTREDVRAAPAATGPQADAAAREVVLPEADKRPMVLDLATGGLILMPSGPEPEKVQQVFRELGKGDILYDVDLDDRTLIFLRDAKSDPPGDDTGEPSVTGHLIKNLPETILVVTKEGRGYEVTILAADERGCTLKYSRIPADRSASGGAPVEPEKTGGALELRITPMQSELAPGVVAEYRKSLIEGRTAADSRYLWFPVRPGTNPPPSAVTEMHADRLWLLVHNTELLIMVRSQGWETAYVSPDTDQSGRPMVRLEFDSAGAERLLHLTKANDNHPLAMIVNGVVVSAPNISSEGTGLTDS